jgi:hypothetical protein
MLALTLPLCGLLFGFGGQSEDGEPTQRPEVAEPDTQVTPLDGWQPEDDEFLRAPEAPATEPEPGTQVTPKEEMEGTVSARAIYENHFRGSSVWFYSSGDIFAVRDTLRDGRIAVAQIMPDPNQPNRILYCANHGTKDSVAFCRYSSSRDHTFLFRACTSEEGFLQPSCNRYWTRANTR